MKLKPICFAFALAFSAATTQPVLAAGEKPAVAASAYTSVEGITEYRLPNGLRVLLAPDDSKPTTTVNITYLVGSRLESYGETGMAHLLEHMVFKGTSNRGNIMQELSKRGMEFNGTTSYDRTNYFETFPANEENLKWALEMEADRMVNSKIARVDLDTEFSVVRNEMEMGENNPFNVLIKQLSAVSFDWHNYGHETIGARSDVEGVKISNLQAFYRKYYQPDNAVLMVAGKFDAKKTLALIEKNFGSIKKPQRVLENTYTREEARDGTREITIHRVGDQQLAALLYPVAAGSHPDAIALDALSEVLAASPSGRLHKKLVEQKLAVRTGDITSDSAEPGYVMFMATLAKDQNIEAAKKVMIETVENVAQQPVTEAELKLAKNKLLNDIEKTINDPQSLCVAMSESIALGDWRMFFVSRDRIDALTTADLDRVAKNYLKADNRSYGQFIPVAKPDRAEIPAVPDVAKLVDGYKGRAAVNSGEVFDATPANIDKRTERLALSNGARLALLSKKTRGETVNGRIVLHMGNEANLFGQSVNKKLAASMLLRGAGSYSRAEIDSRLAELKAKMSVSSNRGDVIVTFDTVRANLPGLLDLLRDVLRAPTFPQAEFDQLVKQNLAAIEAQRSEPQAVAAQAMMEMMNAPYKKGDIRYSDSLDDALALYKAAKLDEVKAYYQQFYGANHADISLVGDFDSAAVKTQLGKVLGDWNSPQAYARVASIDVKAAPQQKTMETPDKANAFYIARLPVVMNDSNPDYPALLVANQIFGGGTKSRLFDRLRQKEGISYGAGSGLSMPALDTTAELTLYAIYAPQNLAKLQTGVKEEMAAFVKNGVTAEELAEAKKAIDQETRVSRSQDASLAHDLNTQLFLKRTAAWNADMDAKIAAVTQEQVNAAIRKYFQPDAFAHFYAGDFAGAAKKAAK